MESIHDGESTAGHAMTDVVTTSDHHAQRRLAQARHACIDHPPGYLDLHPPVCGESIGNHEGCSGRELVRDDQLMKRLPAITAFAVASLLLAGCQSEADRKREICAQWATNMGIDTKSQVEVARKLGIEGVSEDPNSSISNAYKLGTFCSFYR